MNERGDLGVGMIILAVGMMAGMFLFGGRLMHGGHKKETHGQESSRSLNQETQESTATLKEQNHKH